MFGIDSILRELKRHHLVNARPFSTSINTLKDEIPFGVTFFVPKIPLIEIMLTLRLD